jgi:hypothetical protein
MNNEISFNQLLDLAKQRTNPHYFYCIWKRKHCFTGEYDADIVAVNSVVATYRNDSTANSYRAALV